MPRRNVVFASGEIYHVYNRSTGNEDLFSGARELRRALDLFDYYRFKQKVKYSYFKLYSMKRKKEYLDAVKQQDPLVEIFAYALMPEHYHLLLRQLEEDGLSKYITDFQNSFAKYLNKKRDRHGSVFQNPFKAKWIERDEVFTHLSRYIHLNPVTSFLIKLDELPNYPSTSYPYYVSKTKGDIVNTDFLLKMFGSKEKYEKFIANQKDYQRKLHLLKRFALEQT